MFHPNSWLISTSACQDIAKLLWYLAPRVKRLGKKYYDPFLVHHNLSVNLNDVAEVLL